MGLLDVETRVTLDFFSDENTKKISVLQVGLAEVPGRESLHAGAQPCPRTARRASMRPRQSPPAVPAAAIPSNRPQPVPWDIEMPAAMSDVATSAVDFKDDTSVLRGRRPSLCDI